VRVKTHNKIPENLIPESLILENLGIAPPVQRRRVIADEELSIGRETETSAQQGKQERAEGGSSRFTFPRRFISSRFWQVS